MEELNHRQESQAHIGDGQRKDLEEKIDVMWKAIEELKIKVMEERELLRKEKSENEKLMEDQVKLRKQLSVFHLPHCPAYNLPPCPVHSPKHQPFSISKICLDKHNTEEGSFFTGIHQGGDNAGKPPYEDFLQSLDTCSNISFDNLFEDIALPQEDKTNSFALLMSEQWQKRMAMPTTDSKKSREKDDKYFPTKQVHIKDSSCKLIESQLFEYSQKFLDF